MEGKQADDGHSATDGPVTRDYTSSRPVQRPWPSFGGVSSTPTPASNLPRTLPRTLPAPSWRSVPPDDSTAPRPLSSSTGAAGVPPQGTVRRQTPAKRLRGKSSESFPVRRSRLVLRLVAVVWVKWRLFSESGLIYHTYGGAGDSALPRFSLPAATNRCRYGLGQSWRGRCDDRCEWNAAAPLRVRIVPRNGGLGRRVGRGRGGEAGIAPQGRRRGGLGEGAA